MNYKRTTPIPNILFDKHLPSLSLSELRVLLTILRQTNGWHDKRTGKRKYRDRISHGQFQKKTGLSRRVLSNAIAALVSLGLIEVSTYQGVILMKPKERSGKHGLWYRATLNIPVQESTLTYAQTTTTPVQRGIQNKTNREKITNTKTKAEEMLIKKHIEAIRKQLGIDI